MQSEGWSGSPAIGNSSLLLVCTPEHKLMPASQHAETWDRQHNMHHSRPFKLVYCMIQAPPNQVLEWPNLAPASICCSSFEVCCCRPSGKAATLQSIFMTAGFHLTLSAQVESQLEAEKAALLEKKRTEQAERRRTQEELTRILDDNRRKVCCPYF